MPLGQVIATKVILPLDINDLRAGARSFFVGERHYQSFLGELRVSPGDRDDGLLRLLDAAPSLDPFLLRERILAAGFTPDLCFFELADTDLRQMTDFVRQEVEPLVGMTFGKESNRISENARKLAAKLLGDGSDIELTPLRKVLGMGKADFQEGMFCWKGFLYYKWRLQDLTQKIGPILREIVQMTPMGMLTGDETVYIRRSQARLVRAIKAACQTVDASLKVYDDAYRELTLNSRPQAFRAFLIAAPKLFHELGDHLGALQHIMSFWRFRFPEGSDNRAPLEEIINLLNDFDASLAFDRRLTRSAA